MVLSFICMFSYLTVEPFEHNNRPLDEAAAIQKIQRWFKQSFSNKFEFWASWWRLLATHLSSFVWRHKPGMSKAGQWSSNRLEVEEKSHDGVWRDSWRAQHSQIKHLATSSGSTCFIDFDDFEYSKLSESLRKKSEQFYIPSVLTIIMPGWESPNWATRDKLCRAGAPPQTHSQTPSSRPGSLQRFFFSDQQ